MKKTKGLKHYSRIFLLAVLLYGMYTAYIAFTNDGFQEQMIYSIITVPLLFVIFLFGFDWLFYTLFPSKEKKENEDYKEFVKITTKDIDSELELSIEDYRRLRENDKFQKALYHAFQILKKGETTEINYRLLNKKFKKDTTEDDALKIVVENVKKLRETKEKDL
ncbi:MAG: hypothetical protein K9L74_05775 [Candidatus Izimaplasma sp.]|nr:hypothetical protein [Candidatus Izimaplasma bacterium]